MKNSRTKAVLVLITMLIISSISISSASVFLTGVSAVDNGEIRYGGSTQYTTARTYSINTWNGLGEVNIAPDTIYTVEDLNYGDYYDSDTTAAGYYQPTSVGADRLRFNRYYLDNYTDAKKKNVALHELGHALGLAHSTTGNVMYSKVAGTTLLGYNDIDSYNYLYA